MFREDALRSEILREIIDFPEEKLRDLYEFLQSSSKDKKRRKKKSYEGIWKDFSETEFNSFLNDILMRRKLAFSRRK